MPIVKRNDLVSRNRPAKVIHVDLKDKAYN